MSTPLQRIEGTVSVITPTFNAAAFVDRCVAQVVAQGAVVREHIIADGGSTDGTIEKLEALAAVHPHLHVIPGPDRGQSDALNKATAAATGRFINLLNADDFYEDGALTRMAMLLADAQEPTFLAGNCRVFDESGRLLYWNHPNDLRLESLLLGYNHTPHPVNPSAYLYHRQVHDLVSGYDVDEHYAMDLDFIYKCAAKVPMRYVDEHWGNFVYAPGTKTYEDPERELRATQVRRRHIGQLGRVARLRMRFYRVRRLAKRAIKNLLGRA